MNTPSSFHNAKDLWQPTESPNVSYNGHAMCVVGYDDNKYGGAFEIQNSWGTDWGNDGYIWINYNDFAAFVKAAYEIIENLAMYRDAARFAASIQVDMVSGKNPANP
jgi:C1A family cysteine protease